MKRRLASVVSLLAVVFIALAFVLGRWPFPQTPSAPEPLPPPPLPPPPATAAPPLEAPLSTPPPPRIAQPPTAPPAPGPPPGPEDPARVEAEAIALDLRHFGQRFGGNPVGTNAEIVHTLTGGNPQGVRYLSGDHLRLNDQGELIDAWGTPYFFHSLSSLETEIRSAGPDQTLWTSDDIAVK